MPATIIRLSAEPLDVMEHIHAVAGPHAGATASFVGTVRDHDPDASGEVVRLEYSAHPDAGRVLESIVSRWQGDDSLRIAVSHRVGTLDVGDAAIVVCVSSAHRAEAFTVCREIVETVKRELPVWKKQHERDGTHGWVGLV
ncbi:molybdenum cofactor biosynthesis protein MoaE [Okibacterium endophyticum]